MGMKHAQMKTCVDGSMSKLIQMEIPTCCNFHMFHSGMFSCFHCFLVSIVFRFPMVFSSPLFFVSIGFHCNIFSRQIQFLFCMFTWRSRHRMQRLQLMQRNVAARPHAQSTDRCDNAIQCVCCVVRVNMQKCADTLWYASSARRELAAGTPACTPAPNQTNRFV